MIETAERLPKRRRIRSSTKIAIGFVVLVFGLWGAYRLWSNFMVSRIHFGPIQPGKVNLIAMNPGAGYRILVANGIAQLAEIAGGTEFDAPTNQDLQPDSGDVVGAKKIPLRELLQSLQGNEKALSTFVMKLNDIKEDDIPAEAPIWPAADIRKAVEGDPELKKRLEADLNIGLDGTPPPHVRESAFVNGIVIDLPVPIRLDAKGVRTVDAHVLQPYRPNLIQQVENAVAERFDADAARPGVYRDKIVELEKYPDRKENVGKSLLARIAPSRIADLAQKPERVLQKAEVIVNEDQMTSASYRTYKTGEKRELTDLTISLTDEGRDRLWKYSHKRPGFQLLLVVDGVAIAAPRISHELSQSVVTIRQLPDESLVREAVDLMNKQAIGGNER
jgi:hypothetical protein